MTSRRNRSETARAATASRSKWTRRPAIIGLIALSVATIGANGGEDRRDDREWGSYAIGLWGDVPYSEAQEAGVANLIADMNRQSLAFTVNDGDLKQGNGLPVCDDALYAKGLDYFNALRAPAMFTPGDNDWTDCDRPNNGGFDSLERLSFERRFLFGDDKSFGQHQLHQEVQSDALCLGGSTANPTPEGCVENRRWSVGRVTYVTLNVQGSCNNLCGVAFNVAEFAARNAANIAWLHETFAEAARRHSVAVMIISQADPGFSQFEFDAPLRDPKTLAQTSGPSSSPAAASFDGFQAFLLALRAEVIAFGRPVAYVHGDSHYFRIDKPLMDSTGLVRLHNFTRVETFGDHAEAGSNDVQWVKVLVDPSTPEVFAYQPQIVPSNLATVAVP